MADGEITVISRNKRFHPRLHPRYLPKRPLDRQVLTSNTRQPFPQHLLVTIGRAFVVDSTTHFLLPWSYKHPGDTNQDRSAQSISISIATLVVWSTKQQLAVLRFPLGSTPYSSALVARSTPRCLTPLESTSKYFRLSPSYGSTRIVSFQFGLRYLSSIYRRPTHILLNRHQVDWAFN